MASVQIDTKAADGGLKQLLQAKRVSELAIAYVTGAVAPQLGIDCLQDFVAWFSLDKYEDEIRSLIHATTDTVEGLKTPQEKGQTVSRLRQAWKEGRGLSETTQAPGAAGLTDQQLEAPLSTAEKAALDSNWEDHHHLDPQAWLQGCDALVNRTYREWRAKLPQVPTADKVRSITAALQPKDRHEQPLGNDANAVPWMVWETQKKLKIETVVDYYWALRILAFVWGKVGCHKVTSKNDPTKQVWFFDFNQGMSYADRALRQAMQFGGGFPQNLNWMEDRDVKTRTKMMEVQRQGWPAGEALEEAMRDCREDWQSQSRALVLFQASDVPASLGAEGPQFGGSRKRSRSRGQSRSGGQSSSNAGGHQYVSTAKGGKKFCRKFQDGRCVKDPSKCPDKGLHRCNIRMPDAKPCMGKHNHAGHGL